MSPPRCCVLCVDMRAVFRIQYRKPTSIPSGVARATMPISISCPNCSKRINAPDNAAGRQVRCPACQTPFVVPHMALPSAVSVAVATAASRQMRWWLVLLVLVTLFAVLFTPQLLIWLGILFIALCIAAVIRSTAGLFDANTQAGKMLSRINPVLSAVQSFSRRLLHLDPSDKWQRGRRLAAFGFIGLALVFAGWTAAGWKAERERITLQAVADRERIAAQVAAEQAEQDRRREQIAAQVAAEKAKRAQLVNEANTKVDELLAGARNALTIGDIDAGATAIDAAAKVPNATNVGAASRLRKQFSDAVNPAIIQAQLMDLSDQAFGQLKQDGTLPAQMSSGFEGLDRRIAELAKAKIQEVAEQREKQKLARIEEERLTRDYQEHLARQREPPAAPKPYQIAHREDISFGPVRRLQFRVAVPKHYVRDEIQQIAAAIVAETTRSQPVNAISIFFYGPGTSTTSRYDVASVEWVPNGRWADASLVRTGDYSSFAYSVSYKSPLRVVANKLATAGSTGLLGAALPQGATLVERRAAEASADPFERYTIVASASEIAAFFNETMLTAGWKRGGDSTETMLFFERGTSVLGVFINRAGGSFKLMGS